MKRIACALAVYLLFFYTFSARGNQALRGVEGRDRGKTEGKRCDELYA